MSLVKAKEVNEFLINNNISYINIMGGEFFQHPEWFNVVSTLCDGIEVVRIATNGDWVETEGEKVKQLAELYPVVFAISNDRWHTNKNVVAAKEFCSNNNMLHRVATEEQTKEESVVPVGRSEFRCNIYSSFSRYCGKPNRKYSFLINEEGTISKCLFGAWEYADVSQYLDGGFRERFKEFTGVFYSEFIPNCSTCLRIWNTARRNGDV